MGEKLMLLRIVTVVGGLVVEFFVLVVNKVKCFEGGGGGAG